MLLGEQGWHSGKNTGLPPMWPGLNLSMVSRGFSLLLVLALLQGFFSWYSSFPPPEHLKIPI